MRDLLRHRGFRLLVVGQTATLFGDWTLLLVFGIWAHALTGSDAVAGLMVFAMTAPGLLGPLGGVVADRVPRRWLLVGIDLASVPAVLALWCVHDRGQLWLLYAVAVWYGFSSVVVSAAMSGLVQSMLPPQLVGPGNGVLTTIRQGLRLVGPLVGAGLFAAVGGRWVAALDAATFLLSAAALLALHGPERRPERSVVPFRTELGAGFRQLRRTVVLRRLAGAEIGCVLAFGIVEPAVYALLDDGLHRPASFLGVLVAVQGVGAIAGGIVATTTIARLGATRLFGAGLVLLAAGTTAELAPSLGPVLTGFAVFGFGLPVAQVAATTLLQQHTPPAVMGRTTAAFEVLSSVPYTAAIGLGAVLVGVVSYRLLFGAVALMLAVMAAYAWRAVRVPVEVSGPTDRDPSPSLHSATV